MPAGAVDVSSSVAGISAKLDTHLLKKVTDFLKNNPGWLPWVWQVLEGVAASGKRCRGDLAEIPRSRTKIGTLSRQFIRSVLDSMNAGFTTWVWPTEKTHPKLAYQLFYFATRSCPDTPVPDHHGPRFTTIFVRRAESLGRRLKDFNFSTEVCFSWQSFGAYSMVAKAVAADEKDEWHPDATRPYTHVKYRRIFTIQGEVTVDFENRPRQSHWQ